jgi:hypothetical protein
MLLSTLIAAQQETYAAIEIQIQILQEKQREIQAFMQQLGSVESKMVSAAQLVQEAIASINEVCPDELNNYKQLITGLFNAPIASLPSGDDEPDPTPPADSEPAPEVEEEGTEVTVEVQALTLVGATSLIEEIKQEAIAMTWKDLRQYMSDYKLSMKGKREELVRSLVEYCQTRNEVQLQNMLNYLKKQAHKAA